MNVKSTKAKSEKEGLIIKVKMGARKIKRGDRDLELDFNLEKVSRYQKMCS